MMLREKFCTTAKIFSDRPALFVENTMCSYEELFCAACRVAHTLYDEGLSQGTLFAILGARTVFTYEGVWGVVLGGGVYVPLAPEAPAARNAEILTSAGITCAILDVAHLAAFRPLLEQAPPLTIILKSESDVALLTQMYQQHNFVPVMKSERTSAPKLNSSCPDDLLYLLHTSGSTGKPKGVAINNANVHAYTQAALQLLPTTQEDRYIQLPELTFDVSGHSLWLCAYSGAALYVPDKATAFEPTSYLLRHKITHWASVASTVSIMQKLRILEHQTFPDITSSMLTGEALPTSVAEAWAKATPHGSVYNFYGPTEATCVCLAHKYTSDDPAYPHDLVPIGMPFAGTEVLVVDDEMQSVADGEMGELLICGDQLAPGYFNNPEKTKEAFGIFETERGPVRYYKSGDIVQRTPQGYIYLGRKDSQIKFRGYRIELGEIEEMLRKVTREPFAVALARTNGVEVQEIIGYLSKVSPLTQSEVIFRLSNFLPSYMIPSRIIFLDEFPHNLSGKIDRKALLADIEAEK